MSFQKLCDAEVGDKLRNLSTGLADILLEIG